MTLVVRNVQAKNQPHLFRQIQRESELLKIIYPILHQNHQIKNSVLQKSKPKNLCFSEIIKMYNNDKFDACSRQKTPCLD